MKNLIKKISSLFDKTIPEESNCTDNFLVVFLTICAVSFSVLCFLWPLNSAYDDMGLYNISYMTKETFYPSYPALFTPTMAVAHPPVIYYILGLLEKAGLDTMTARHGVIAFFYIISIIALGTGKFYREFKVVGATALFAMLLPMVETGTGRPEVYFFAAGIAGFFLLENSRLDNWSKWKAFTGAFILVLASEFHYPYHFACLGIIFYYIWGFFSKTNPAKYKYIISLTCGAFLAGLPYLFLVIIPFFYQVKEIVVSSDRTSSIWENIKIHFLNYKGSACVFYSYPWICKGVIFITSFYIIAPVFSLIGLFSKNIRGFVLALQPMLWFLFLFMYDKAKYMQVEFFTVFIILAFLLSVLFLNLISRFFAKAYNTAFIIFTCAMFLGTIFGEQAFNRYYKELRFQTHAMHIIRALSLDLDNGKKYNVAEGNHTWYTSGADRFLSCLEAIAWSSSLPTDADFKKEFLKFFDGVISNSYTSYYGFTSSNAPGGKHSFERLYIDGILKPYKFVLYKPVDDAGFVMLVEPEKYPDTKLKGYVLMDPSTAIRFDEDPKGSYVFYSIMSEENEPLMPFVNESLAHNRLYLARVINPEKKEIHVDKAYNGVISAGKFDELKKNAKNVMFIDEIKMSCSYKNVDDIYIKYKDTNPVHIYNTLAEVRSDYYYKQLKAGTFTGKPMAIDWESHKIINTDKDTPIDLSKFTSRKNFRAKLKKDDSGVEYLYVKSDKKRFSQGIMLPELSVDQSGLYLFCLEYVLNKNGEMSFAPWDEKATFLRQSTKSYLWSGWSIGKMSSGKTKSFLAAEYYIEKGIPFKLQFSNDAYNYFYPTEAEIYSIKIYYSGNREPLPPSINKAETTAKVSPEAKN